MTEISPFNLHHTILTKLNNPPCGIALDIGQNVSIDQRPWWSILQSFANMASLYTILH